MLGRSNAGGPGPSWAMGESKLKRRGLQGVAAPGSVWQGGSLGPRVGEPGTGSQGLGPARLAATGLEQTQTRTSDFANYQGT